MTITYLISSMQHPLSTPCICCPSLLLSFTLLSLQLFTLLSSYYCCHHITVSTNKFCQASIYPGVAELTTRLLRLIGILWLPLCRINKFGLKYFPRRLLRSPTL